MLLLTLECVSFIGKCYMTYRWEALSWQPPAAQERSLLSAERGRLVVGSGKRQAQPRVPLRSRRAQPGR